VTVKIDSLATGMATSDVLPGTERPTRYYLTVLSGADTTHFTIPVQMDATPQVRDAAAFAQFGATALDSAQAARFGGTSSLALFGKATLRVPGVFRVASWGRGDANSNPGSSSFNGPRWWSGAANEKHSRPQRRQLLLCEPQLRKHGPCPQHRAHGRQHRGGHHLPPAVVQLDS